MYETLAGHVHDLAGSLKEGCGAHLLAVIASESDETDLMRSALEFAGSPEVIFSALVEAFRRNEEFFHIVGAAVLTHQEHMLKKESEELGGEE